MSSLVILTSLIGLEIVCVPIDGVIGQVHEQTIHIPFHGALIFLSCESGEALSEDEHPKRINPVNEDIDPHVELEPINEKRFMHIPLHDILLASSLVYALIIPGEVDATALAVGHRLHNKCLRLLNVELRL
jgi:hypothetical protein